jgi:two-component sensor histidine kinase
LFKSTIKYQISTRALTSEKIIPGTSIYRPVSILPSIDYLNESLSTSAKQVIINQQIESVYLDVSQAIPVGIILNEAITNAIKYAFPLKKMGEINVSMEYVNGLVDLEISDNGVGFPPEFDFQKANSLGMNLMKGLVNQLKGTFKFNVHNGVNIRIKFSLDHISALT